MKKPKILVGLPTMGNIHVMLGITVMSWLSQAYKDGDYDLSVYPTVAVQPVDNARNQIVREFLESDCSHLLFVDSDTMPPQSALRQLLAVNQPIVSGLTPIIELDEVKKEYYRKWNCVGMDGKYLSPNTGVIPIKGAGSSCILIRREVFEKLTDPWYRFVYQDDNGKTEFNGEPLIISEDVHFIMQAVAAGIPVFCDTSVVCAHHKSTIW